METDLADIGNGLALDEERVAASAVSALQRWLSGSPRLVASCLLARVVKRMISDGTDEVADAANNQG